MTAASARAAISLLTVLPVGADPARAGAAIVWFVPVGAAIGALVALLDAVLSLALPAILVAPLDLIALAVVTGGLHLDGLADSADGLFAGGDAQRRLAIMREPGVGSFAAAAVTLVLLVDAAALAASPARPSALWLAAVCSRWAMGVAIWAFPYARPSGLGASYRMHARTIHVVVATALTALLALPFELAGVAAIVVATTLAALIGARARSVLGGLTGDVYGAIGEVTFAGVLVGVVAVR